jgi:hypothetical protein
MQLLTWATLLPLALAAPVIQPRGVQLIPGNYIVKLKDGASERTLQDAIRHVKAGSPKHVYRSGRFKGFAARLSPQVLDEVSKLPEVRSKSLTCSLIECNTNPTQVEYIEQDGVVRASDFVTQEDVPWGLARISHRETGATSYVYDDSAGEGTCSYVIDTGIYVEHNVSSVLAILYPYTCPLP